jgi:hypothetical protein
MLLVYNYPSVEKIESVFQTLCDSAFQRTMRSTKSTPSTKEGNQEGQSNFQVLSGIDA